MKKLFIFSICITFPLYGATIGSYSAVGRFNTQQILNDGDDIAAFAALQGGFSLNGSDVVATFSSEFGVSGDIDLNGGMLVLRRDLVLDNVSSIGFLGDIQGNFHRLQLSETSTCIPDVAENIRDCVVTLVESISVDMSNVEVVAWSFDERFLAVGGDSFGLNQNVLINYEFINNNLVITDSTFPSTAFEINDIRWHPSEYLFVAVKELGGAPDEVNVFSVNSTTGALTLVSSDAIGSSVQAAAWHPTGDYIAVGTVDNAGEIIIYPVSSGGILDTGGALLFNLIPSRDVQYEAQDWDITGSYLAVGVNTNGSDPELLVYEFNDQPSLSLTLNASEFIGATVTRVDWNRTYTDLVAIGLGTISGEIVRVYQHDAQAGTLTQVAGIPGIGKVTEGVDWHPDGNCLAISTDFFSGNSLFRTYAYNNSTQTFVLATNVQDFTDDVEGVRWSPGGCFVALADDSGAVRVYELIRKVCKICFEFSNLTVALTNDADLKGCCIKFSGNSMIDGNGNRLTLDDDCEIQIASDSSLELKDIIIKGIKNSNIQPLDSSSTLSLNSVAWMQDGNFSFTKGHFDVIDEWLLSGDGYTFVYQSDQISTIQEYGCMNLDTGFTFSYDPSINSNLLLHMITDTSKFKLSDATLFATNVGLQLIKGKLIIDGNCSIISEATMNSQAVQFGDGIDSSNDLTVQWLAKSGLEVSSGMVIYDNIGSC